jgi:hypothetical protein
MSTRSSRLLMALVFAAALFALTACAGNSSYPPAVFRAAEQACAPYGGLKRVSAWETTGASFMITAECVELYTEVHLLVKP